MCALDVQGLHVPVEASDVLLRELVDADPVGLRFSEDVVFNVGEVLDVTYFVAAVLQVPAEHIEHDVAHGMTDVAGSIEVGAADVQVHAAAIDRGKFFYASTECIVQPKRHVGSPS